MRIEQDYSSSDPRTVRIWPLDDDDGNIIVYRYVGSLIYVGWKGEPSVSPMYARLFAEALLKAVEICESWE